MVDQSCNPERVREAAWHFPSRQRNAVERIVVVVVVAAAAVDVAVIAPADTRSITKLKSARSESFETAALAACIVAVVARWPVAGDCHLIDDWFLILRTNALNAFCEKRELYSGARSRACAAFPPLLAAAFFLTPLKLEAPFHHRTLTHHPLVRQEPESLIDSDTPLLTRRSLVVVVVVVAAAAVSSLAVETEDVLVVKKYHR